MLYIIIVVMVSIVYCFVCSFNEIGLVCALALAQDGVCQVFAEDSLWLITSMDCKWLHLTFCHCMMASKLAADSRHCASLGKGPRHSSERR